MRTPLVFLAASLLLVACTGATYNASVVGYEVHSPPAFLSADSHSESRLEQTKLGIPIDLAITHFGASRDVLLGGAGETYLVMAVHGTFQLLLEDTTLLPIDQALSQSFAPFGLAVTDRQKLAPTPLTVGEELTFAPAQGATIKRSIHVRLFAAEHSVYFLLNAVDAEDANAKVFATRRQHFFDGFHVTPTARIEHAPVLQEEKLAMLGRVIGEAVTSTKAE
jgi:hypothetical protein